MRKFWNFMRNNPPVLILSLFILYWIISRVIWAISLEQKQDWFEQMAMEAWRSRGWDQQTIEQSD